MDKKTNDEKKCWACKRAYMINEGKIGLCPKCINKYGTPVASIGIAGLSIGGRQLIKHGGKIIKTAANVAKKVKH
ncbi:hypothetical protein HNQ56_000781 [Anaerotaenia torta]|uniref:hypothetical protein n=1 Tax=Anaerotaenia torta TaxID=433293 RepID=UPI003D196ED5